MPRQTHSPEIYVVFISSSGDMKEHGGWIDAGQAEDLLLEEIAELMEEAPFDVYPEWVVDDSADFGDKVLETGDSAETIVRKAELIIEHGDAAIKLIEHDNNIDWAESLFRDGYHGHWKNLEEYAEEFIADTQGKPDGNLAYYIDYEEMGQDWENSGDIFTLDADNGGIYVFSGHI